MRYLSPSRKMSGRVKVECAGTQIEIESNWIERTMGRE